MSTTPTDIPSRLRAGDTWQWNKTLTDYPAGDGWALSYVLLNSAGKITINSSADGDDHAVSVSAAASAGYTAGEYRFFAYIAKDDERFPVDEGEITVEPDPATTASLDTRSEAQIQLERIDTLLAGAGTAQSYSIGTPDGTSRTLNRYDITALKELRSYWKGRRNIEIARERTRRGLSHQGIVKAYLP
jgi:hypothetical protein